MRPGHRRDHVGRVIERYRISERKACRALAWPRSSQRYRSRARDATPLRMRLKELVLARPRYGYRRHILLRRDGWMVNHKRGLRLYRAEGPDRWPAIPRAHGARRLRTRVSRVLEAPTKLPAEPGPPASGDNPIEDARDLS
jgi:hypothetical protein